MIIVRSHCYHHNYIKPAKISENTFAVSVSVSSWKQPFRLECCKMFAKYLKNIVERVNVLV